MTTILDDDLLSKIAVYWPPGDIDEDGERAVGTPEEMQCHWEDEHRETIDENGKEFISQATVYLKQAVDVGGWLWLSSKTVDDAAGSALAEAPATPNHNLIIRSCNKMPDMDNDETLYRAHL